MLPCNAKEVPRLNLVRCEDNGAVSFPRSWGPVRFNRSRILQLAEVELNMHAGHRKSLTIPEVKFISKQKVNSRSGVLRWSPGVRQTVKTLFAVR